MDSPEEEARKRFTNRTSALRTDVFRFVGLIRCKLTTWILSVCSHESRNKKENRLLICFAYRRIQQLLRLFYSEESFKIAFESSATFEPVS